MLRRTLPFLALLLPTLALAGGRYPLGPDSLCGATRTCRSVIDAWNDATWSDVVDENIQTGTLPLAAVRWYSTEGTCTGTLCSDQLRTHGGKVIDLAQSRFVGVTDELSNVLLSHAMGSNQSRYEKLRNFTELLRRSDKNGLQCWKYYVDGDKNYASPGDVECLETDSAADASVRILGAYAIGCAKQRSGVWGGTTDYCADYVRQGNAIWGRGTASHGEIKLLPNGEYYFAASYNNQPSAPSADVSFRPDYYELQFLMDFAKYVGDQAMVDGVVDMIEDYVVSTGSNHIHRGQAGKFDATTTTYSCNQLCTPEYMDANDTWRAIPALSNLRVTHPAEIPSGVRSWVFDHWWLNFGGGNATYGVTNAKPIEIYSQASSGGVKRTEESYKTLSMWIPLAVAQDRAYARSAIAYLVDNKYDWTNRQFYGAAYYGAYFSQFAQRAIGVATGMIAPMYASRGDYSGNARADLFWRKQSTGDNALWLMNGTTVESTLSITAASPEWHVAGLGNFDGSTTTDVLWRRPATGENAVWFLRASGLASSAWLPSIGTNWSAAGTGDFDGDGRSDILWRSNSTGETLLWRMNGATVLSSTTLPAAASNWEVLGTADFGGDAKSDILWRNTSTSEVVIWKMDGATRLGITSVASPSSDWVLKGIGDVDADGKADLVWRHATTYATVLWRMNESGIAGTGTLPSAASPWDLRAMADFNGDGKCDLMWRHAANGDNAVWLMDGATVVTAAYIDDFAETGFTVVDPSR